MFSSKLKLIFKRDLINNALKVNMPHNSNVCIIPLIASIDVGTTSSRVILFNKLGKEVTKHQIEYSTTITHDNELDGTHKDTIFSSIGMLIKEDENLEIEELHRHTRLRPNGVRHASSNDVIKHDCLHQVSDTNYLNETELSKFNSTPTLSYPKPGWVECNPINMLYNVLQCLGSALLQLNKLNLTRLKNQEPIYKINCIGITNMRETTIVWNKDTGLPIVPYGIVWNDIRNSDIIKKLKNSIDNDTREIIERKTGLPLFSTYFSCSKLRWLLDSEPDVFETYQMGKLMFGTVDTWLIYNLSSKHKFITDVTNASRTGFMNLETMDYDSELLKFWSIDPTLINLPQILSSSQFYDTFKLPKICHSMDPKIIEILDKFSQDNVPIQGCLGDQSASLVGQMAYKKGSAKCTYGTGCFLLYNTGIEKLESRHGAITTIAYWFPNLVQSDLPDLNKPHFALEGSIAVAGSVVQWLRDNLRLFPRAQDIGPLANKVKDSGGVVFVPAFNGLFAPYWDPNARATIIGISQYTTASHIARAAVEGVCFQCRSILKAMTSDVYGDKLNPNIDLLEDNANKSQNNSQDNESSLNNVSFAYERKLFSTLSVDGGMSRSNEVMQIQADILGPCIKIRRSPVSESTALGAAIAANMAFKDSNDRPLWKDMKDVKRWVFHGGIDNNLKCKGIKEVDDISDESNINLKYFYSESKDETRRKHWRMWEIAVKRSMDWITEIEK